MQWFDNLDPLISQLLIKLMTNVQKKPQPHRKNFHIFCPCSEEMCLVEKTGQLKEDFGGKYCRDLEVWQL